MSAGNSAVPPPPNPPQKSPLRRADQIAVALLSLFALATIAGYWFSQAKLRGRLIDIERPDRPAASFRIDINSADWPELIQLPGLGETLARRIVAWRKAHGRLTSIDQLRQVSGVGPKRLESWRAYLQPIEPIAGQASIPSQGNTD
jgi:competence protein ComEA